MSHNPTSSNNLAAPTPTPTPPTPPPRPSISLYQQDWKRLGLNAALSEQLLKTHPHITAPTLAQRALIPAVLAGSSSSRRNAPLSDLILRAHTGTGKSFGLLLALLAKPRILFGARQDGSTRSSTSSRLDVDAAPPSPPKPGIASILLVPSNELAWQYLSWAQTLFPASSGVHLDDVIQCHVRLGNATAAASDHTVEATLSRLRKRPPHVLVCTPTRFLELLGETASSRASARVDLGLDTLRTLVLDEADALLDVPPRFPTAKQMWRHSKHPPAGLRALEEVMKLRATCSGGEAVARCGLEMVSTKAETRVGGLDRLPKESVRRAAHKGREATLLQSRFAPARPRRRRDGTPTAGGPLQLVVVSATAGSVLRNFLGARTGWLRTDSAGETDSHARWIDLTGLSGRGRATVEAVLAGGSAAAPTAAAEAVVPSVMPRGLEHHCVVVHAPTTTTATQRAGESGGGGTQQVATLRNLRTSIVDRPRAPPRGEQGEEGGEERYDDDARTRDGERDRKGVRRSSRDQARNGAGAERDEAPPEGRARSYLHIVPTAGTGGSAWDEEGQQLLVRALALVFADQGVRRGLAVIPPKASLRRTVASLESLGVPVRLFGGPQPSSSGGAGPDGHADADADDEAELWVIQATSARGLDLAGLSHVFIVGVESVGDAVQYAHLAGRVGREVGVDERGRDAGRGRAGGRRAGSAATAKPRTAKVVTLLRGVDEAHLHESETPEARNDHSVGNDDDGEGGAASAILRGQPPRRVVVSAAELKVANLLRLLGVRPKPLRLGAVARAMTTPPSPPRPSRPAPTPASSSSSSSSSSFPPSSAGDEAGGVWADEVEGLRGVDADLDETHGQRATRGDGGGDGTAEDDGEGGRGASSVVGAADVATRVSTIGADQGSEEHGAAHGREEATGQTIGADHRVGAAEPDSPGQPTPSPESSGASGADEGGSEPVTAADADTPASSSSTPPPPPPPLPTPPPSSSETETAASAEPTSVPAAALARDDAGRNPTATGSSPSEGSRQ